ncbi:PREDICTED: uncharacterized protein C14orf182-like [Lipotes vexillifer]|uniref:Uncharacterized protein C14orf182-like n=1 Tax=Lipotes vexillifer TaxID=118797 RepID=A0A340WVD1_LIPVE|nr:PREDICTED: uncharacterized protein C14orf182-like [Lipotes vexillifer]
MSWTQTIRGSSPPLLSLEYKEVRATDQTTGLMATQDKPHRTCLESNRAPDVVQEPRGLSRSNTALKRI